MDTTHSSKGHLAFNTSTIEQETSREVMREPMQTIHYQTERGDKSLLDNDQTRQHDDSRTLANLAQAFPEVKKKKRDEGFKMLNQLTKSLSRVNLEGGNNNKNNKSVNKNDSNSSKKITKSQRKKANRAAREEKQKLRQIAKEARMLTKAERRQRTRESQMAAAARKGKSIDAIISNEKGHRTRSVTGKLPSGFNTSLLGTLSNATDFMDSDQIKAWIDSVYTPHIESWYHECLRPLADKTELEAAHDDPLSFAEKVVREAIHQHDSTRLMEPLLSEQKVCPSAFHLDMRQRNMLSFTKHTAMTACFIVRDGQRSDKFAGCEREEKLHRAAALMLTSAIMDLNAGNGYFSRLVPGIEEDQISGEEGGRDAPYGRAAASTSRQQHTSTVRRAQASLGPNLRRTFEMPANLFENIQNDLGEVQRTSNCRVSFHKQDALGLVREVVIVGRAVHFFETEEVIRKLMDSSVASPENMVIGTGGAQIMNDLTGPTTISEDVNEALLDVTPNNGLGFDELIMDDDELPN